MTDLEQLTALASSLKSSQISLLIDMATAMSGSIKQEVATDSDICSPEFTEYFANRLRLYHAFATAGEKFNKKGFEFAFLGASEAARRIAYLTTSATEDGADATVDGVRFSLKTEASAGIRLNAITISKFQEAAWIRNCTTGEDFQSHIHSRVIPHLSRYDRIVILRAFDVLQSGDAFVRYDLVEIPKAVLFAMGELKPDDFTVRTAKGGTSAIVRWEGEVAFSLRIDGSVEKVTISSLRTTFCKLHAQWFIPMKSRNIKDVPIVVDGSSLFE